MRESRGMTSLIANLLLVAVAIVTAALVLVVAYQILNLDGIAENVERWLSVASTLRTW